MKTIWIALSFVATCCGLILGTSLRNRQETGSGLFSSSQLLALRNGGGNSSDTTPWFPATAYYDQVRRIIASEYVEPDLNETEMARSSLQYMLRSLGDPETRYYRPEQWKAYLERLSGTFEGIGADVIALETMTSAGFSMPIKVISTAKGGFADRAGLESGDVIESIDGRWVASRSLFLELQKASDAFTEKKMSRDEYDHVWQRIRDKSERMISIEEALEKLQTGEGPLALEVVRNGKTMAFKVERGSYRVSPIEVNDDSIRVNVFAPGSAEDLLQAVQGKDAVTIDLRGTIGGAITEVEKALRGIIGSGVFVQLKVDPNAPLEKLRLTGNDTKTPPKLTVIVDPGTAREAEVFAIALRDAAGASISGGSMAGLGRKIERFSLPDGSGYCITAGHYYDMEGKSLVREDAAARKAREAAEAAQ
jgi:carboxyl-terminal processing protease